MKDPTIQLWCEDEVHFQRHSSLIRMWAPKGQQPRVLSPSVRHKVGFFGALNLKTGCLLTKEAYVQCRDLWRLCPLSSSIYSRENLPYSGQCQMAQSARFERLIRCQSGPNGTYLPAVIFPRTQSSGTSVEDYSPAGNPQPLFPIARRTKTCPNFSFYEMGAAKQRT